MHHNQLPEAENGNGKSSITWKVVVLAVCLPLIGAMGGRLWDSAGAEVKALKESNEKNFAVVHKRISELDLCKVDEKTWEMQNTNILGMLKDIKDDLKDIKKRR
jgi:hypothetical protein